MCPVRTVSDMRPKEVMHFDHFHGLLKNWVRLQAEMPCLFFFADWFALATRHDDTSLVRAIVADDCDNARKLAQETMRDVCEEMGLSHG
jgi:tryptophanyl-tRNA synthetase